MARCFSFSISENSRWAVTISSGVTVFGLKTRSKSSPNIDAVSVFAFSGSPYTRYDGITYSKKLYKQRNLIERCFNKLKQFRHIATRYDRTALNYLAMLKIACLRLWLRFYESAA